MSIPAVIYVLGLGSGDPLDLPARNLSLMRSADTVYLRTNQHPVIPYLQREGVRVHPLDSFYERYDSFKEVYSAMTAFLLQEAQKERVVAFAVPGSPLIGEAVVRLLRKQGPAEGIGIKIFPAPGFLDSLYQLLEIDPGNGLVIADSFEFIENKGTEVPTFRPHGGTGLVVMQLYSSALASEVKLTLMDYYPDDHRVMLVRAAGMKGSESVLSIPLYELDRQHTDHLTALYVPPGITDQEQPSNSLDPLVKVMDELLSPEGCPWDRQQTHQTLKKYLIEEAYEVLDAIDEGNMHKICEELGDLLLQIAFHAALAERSGEFTMSEVVSGITKKLVRRHPHVFGEVTVENAAEVLENWEAIKQREGEDGEPRSMLAGVPRYLPALQRAQKVQSKAALGGFDWPEAAGAALKVEEEWKEVKAAWEKGDQAELQRELGDFIFAAVNTCRLLQFDAEETLRMAVDKFIKRFCFMEKKTQQLGLQLAEMPLSQLDELWEEAKSREREGR